MSKNTIKESYKGFDLISETEIQDCSSTGIYLRHRKTGLEVFHLLNDDEENLFAFAFRTPTKDSTGAAHITEHSVFCGSEKFPLKEPFANMMNQSVNTFLNALTYSDKTVYPASSTVKADYFNLMDVYGDAVFFPLLKKEAFLQEAHRIEFDENGKPSIQGVVYNEMKGSYSSFDSVATDVQIRSLFPDTNYAYDSGGDPLVIPNFSYEDFKAFHKKHYCPDNCLVFLYGNIPTEEQLDFLQANFLDRLEKKYPVPVSSDYYPNVPQEYADMETPAPREKTVRIKATAPASGATGSTVSVSWHCGNTKDLSSYIECAFMAEVISGHDGSPLTKALLDSGLGDDLAPICGVVNETRNFVATYGLQGVKKRNESKVFKLILNTLKEICKKGVSKEDVDAALTAVDFANREIVRAGGPYSLVLLDRALYGWNYGRNPADTLQYRQEFEKVRKHLAEEPDYIVHLIQRFMLENDRVSYVTVRPSKKYLSDRTKKESRLLKELVSKVDVEQVKKDLELLHAYQNHHETAEEVSCIPALDISQLKTDVENIVTDIQEIQTEKGMIPVFKNVEPTNGIAYFEVCIPTDCLDPEGYLYLTLFSYCSTNCGWLGKSWDVCASEAAVACGGVYSRTMMASKAKTARSEKLAERIEKYNCVERDWLIFSVRVLSEKMDEAMKVFSDALRGFEFTDEKRIKTLVSEAVSSIKSSVVPRGNRYALKRAQCTCSHGNIVEELQNGISQLFFLDRISKEKTENIVSVMNSMTEKLRKAGAILHLTADEATMEKAVARLPEFIKCTDLGPVKPAVKQDDEAFKKLLLLPGEKEAVPSSEVFTVDSQVGFAAAIYEGSFFGEKENSHDLVFAHWLSGSLLWERIRTGGGAYGAYAGCGNLVGLFSMATFRDPTPEKSLITFDKCLEDAAEALIDQEECVRNVTGTYGDEVQPRSPSGRGVAGFNRTLLCVDDSDRNDKLKNLLAVNPEEIKGSARRILEKKGSRRTVIIGGKNTKNTGVIVDLPL